MEDALKYLDPDVIRKIDNLQLAAKFIVEGFYTGLHKSPYLGFSTEFASYRKYVPGDNLRYIDWKVYGRTDKFYMRQFEERTNADCTILLDSSASMSMEDEGVNKMQYSKFLTAGLSYMLLKQRDTVGLCTVDSEQLTYFPASNRNTQLTQILVHLSNLQGQGETDLNRGLELVLNKAVRRGIVIVISDFLDEPADILQRLKLLRFRNHDILIFQILTDAELRFPYPQAAVFVDMETGEELTIRPADVRAEYLRVFGDHNDSIERESRGLGIDFVRLATNESLGLGLMAFLGQRSS